MLDGVADQLVDHLKQRVRVAVDMRITVDAHLETAARLTVAKVFHPVEDRRCEIERFELLPVKSRFELGRIRHLNLQAPPAVEAATRGCEVPIAQRFRARA